VVLGPARGAVEVRGLATGTRELDALSPLHTVPRCDALFLTGGSAFGLAAADGVVGWLEERGRGFRTPAARVPIVPGAVLYDLGVGDPAIRPDAAMGRAAAAAAGTGPVEEGAVGAGAGATVGKLRGGEGAAAGGVGSWTDDAGEGAVGALAVVNAFGDVTDGAGEILAGARSEDGGFLDTVRSLREGARPAGFGEDPGQGRGRNTTLGVVATDVPLDTRALQIVARQATHALARRVRPAETPFDGDVVFALSTGREAPAEGSDAGDQGAVLSLALRAQEALEGAIERAVDRPPPRTGEAP
jgi:L-aminopeptidase/D-esterase-like protein